MSDVERADHTRSTVEVVPGVWLIHAPEAGEGRWFWQCDECGHAWAGDGPLGSRESAEAGALAHRH